MKVAIIVIAAKTIFKSSSVVKKLVIILTFSWDFSSSLFQIAYDILVFIIANKLYKKAIDLIFFINKKYMLKLIIKF